MGEGEGERAIKRERERERERETEREREREREREVCAHWERETSLSCGSQLQMHNIYICYKQDTQEARSTRTRRRLSW